MMMPSAKPPASAEKCPIGKTITVYAKMPMTMDGTPMRASTRKRMSSLNSARSGVLGQIHARPHAKWNAHCRCQRN